MEMETLEKNIEVRAEKLLKAAVIKIQSSKNAEESNSGENMQTDVNSDESMEIEWDRVGENLFSKEGADKGSLLSNTMNKSVAVELRRSTRNRSDGIKIQEKTEAVKKKNNEISGTLSSFTVLNSIDPFSLENVATASNIVLGKHADEISKTISTIQPKEIAKATLLEAKQKILQAKQKEQERTHTTIERGKSEEAMGEPDENIDRHVDVTGKEKVSDVGTVERDGMDETAETRAGKEAPAGEAYASNRPKKPPKEPPAGRNDRGGNGRRYKKQK
jgi:hypothetical protein